MEKWFLEAQMMIRRWLAIALVLWGCGAPEEEALEQARYGMVLTVPAEYETIQAAIYAAGGGDTVLVAAGEYTENVSLQSGITLEGAGVDVTIIRGQVKFKGGDFSKVTGFTITADGASGYSLDSGVVATGEEFKVIGNIIEGFGTGILAGEENMGLIEGNIIRQNGVGIEFSEAGPWIYCRNNLILNNTKSGLMLYSNAQPHVAHNTIVGNGFGQSYGSGGAGVSIGPFNNETLVNNIIVSNHGGINGIYESNSKDNHNLVWGNVDNYVGAAKTGAGDLSVDPRFVSPGAKDYRLQADSPAIDMATNVGVTTDFDGNPRPAGEAPDLGAFEVQLADDSGDFVISEVLSNPLDEKRGEFVELYNPTDGPVDAAGLVLDDGDSTDAIKGWQGGDTVVPAGSYAVILDPDYANIAVAYDIPNEAVLLSVNDSTLGSGLSVADPVSIVRDGVVLSTYAYPFNPGNGLSAERIDVEGDDLANNWVASPCGNSPGKANCISAGGADGDLPSLIISEVMAAPAVAKSGEFIEVYNFGDVSVDLIGLAISDGDSTDTLVAIGGKAAEVAAGEYCVIIDPDLAAGYAGSPYFLGEDVPCVVTVAGTTLGDGLAKNDPVALLAVDGVTAIATYSHPLPASAQSIERIDLDDSDLAGNWLPSPCAEKHSAGKANCAAGGGEPVDVPILTINEVMANPLDEDTGEFVEIFNGSDGAVDLAGMVLSDGDATDVLEAFEAGGPTVVPAKGYGVVLDPEFAGDYQFPADAILLAPGNSTLGNGLANNDPISLLASNGVTEIAAYSYPMNAGNGVSVANSGGGDQPAAWAASSCVTGSSPGAANCGAEGEGPPGDGESDLVISEVMANPETESTGEFVEIVNVGAEPVDLAGYILSDGDSTDVLVAFGDGGTELAADGIAVVLDSDYDGNYLIPDSAVLLTAGKTLGSGLSVDDPVSLLLPNGVTVVASFVHPFNPGNGVSAESIDLTLFAEASNWVASTCNSGSSPGAPNCAAGADPFDGITVVDVNSALAEELEQVSGIGPATAGQIVAYRESNGDYEALLQLTAIDAITAGKIGEWSVAEADEDPFVIGLDGALTVKAFASFAALEEGLPAADAPEAAEWTGLPVRIQRAAALTEDDSEDNQELTFTTWADEGSFTPAGASNWTVALETAPGEGNYERSQTNQFDAMTDWEKEDGAPYLLPDFYRWSAATSGGGAIRYGAVYAIEGHLDIVDGEWILRVRAGSDAGADRLVVIERWLAADSWASLVVVWTYGYKSVIVKNSGGYTHTLPYRLALAHPCRSFWEEKTGNLPAIPKCSGFGQCGGDIAAAYALFNQALTEWLETPEEPEIGYCFTYSGSDYCFSTEQEETGLDIINNATFGQLKEHCYTTSLASTVVANRPFASIAAYDATPGVGAKSLWNLLVCYVMSGDWPPAPDYSVQSVLQSIPASEGELATVKLATVSFRNGSMFEICDTGTEYCIKVFSYDTLPDALSKGDTVTVKGKVTNYEAGGYWELLVSGTSGYVLIDLDE
jgi:serine protease